MATIFGNISNPFNQVSSSPLLQGSSVRAGGTSGLIVIGNNLIKLVIVVAGLYAFINIIVAGYGFLSSTDPKEINKSWTRIWQSMLGLFVIAGSFVLAAIFGWVIFKDPKALLVPTIYAP